MAEIDRYYIGVALLVALIGMVQGLYMGIASDNQMRAVHIALMLNGFVVLAIFGMVFRLWPALAQSRLAAAQFWLAMIGTLGLVVGTYQFATTGGTAIVAVGAVLTILATALLVWLFWINAKQRA